MDDTWSWWKDETTDSLYRRSKGEWDKWTRCQAAGNYAKYHQPTPSLPPPLMAIRASIMLNQTETVVTVRSTGAQQAAATQSPHTFTERIEALPHTQKWAAKSITLTGSLDVIANAIRQGTAIAISDGSLKDTYGTAAMVIEASPAHRLRAVNIVPSPIKPGDSHRCELAGLYGLVVCCNVLCEQYEIEQGRINIACDNINAIGVFDDEYHPHPKYENFDLESAVYTQAQNSNIHWTAEHVKGHQDDKLHHTLTHKELLNVEMDKLAKQYWVHLMHTSGNFLPVPPEQGIAGEGWQIWVGDKKLNSPNTNTLYDTIHTPITQNWWIRHKHIARQTLDQIDWAATGSAMQSLPHNHRLWVTKTASHNCGVGTTLVTWKYQDDAKCPRCNEQQEDPTHVTQCRGLGANKIFRKSMRKLKRLFDNEQTDPRISRAILSSFRTWRKKKPLDLHKHDEDIGTAITQQSLIGWQAFVWGFQPNNGQSYNNHTTVAFNQGKRATNGYKKSYAP